MKLIFIYLLICFTSKISFSQCNVQSNEREDGVTIRYLRPDRVGRSDKFMFAVSLQTDGSVYYVATISVFQFEAKKLKGNMILKFSNNKSSTLEHYQSSITTFNGYPATLSIFISDKNDIKNISTSNLKYALVQMENGTFQNVRVIMNSDILNRQYNCLK